MRLLGVFMFMLGIMVAFSASSVPAKFAGQAFLMFGVGVVIGGIGACFMFISERREEENKRDNL